MKKPIAALAAVTLGVGAYLILQPGPEPSGSPAASPAATSAKTSSTKQRAVPPVPPIRSDSGEAAGEAAGVSGDSVPALTLPPNHSDPELREELDRLQRVFLDYRSVNGTNPVGNNAEITAALLGGNAKGFHAEIPPGSRVNEGGELADRWGTPYFFHQLSGTSMEIRSAGPDKTHGTADDTALGK